EGHIWGSMRRTAFILGSGLLLLMAHWNCVTGHFQRFWGVSGYFWQAQWERLLSTFEGKEWLLYILAPEVALMFPFCFLTLRVTQVPLLVYWTFSGLLLVADVTGKPNFISRYRIQVSNNDCVDPMKLRQSTLMMLFNQLVISLPMLVSLYPILKLLLHHPKLYKKIHKKHHEWTVPITATCLSVHPIEHVINMLLAILAPKVMGSPLSSITTCISLALTFTMISHCGYHLPFLPSPEFHDYQHQKVDQCYGALGMLDYRHGTDTVFKQAKAYKRHMILLGFTPLS
ncbi:hypothetical protein Celaphus_00003790, partial [Cervus elaphus hippelaphus]